MSDLHDDVVKRRHVIRCGPGVEAAGVAEPRRVVCVDGLREVRTGHKVVSVHWCGDLEKPREKGAAAVAHSADARIRTKGCFGPVLTKQEAVRAGCSQANNFARMSLYEVLEQVHADHGPPKQFPIRILVVCG